VGSFSSSCTQRHKYGGKEGTGAPIQAQVAGLQAPVGLFVLTLYGIRRFHEPFREMYGAYWVGMVLPNPLTSHAGITGVMGVEHVRYEGRLGVKRRASVDYRRDNCRRIRSRMPVICTNSVLYGPHMAPGRSLGVYRTMVGQLVLYGLSTDMLVVLTPAPRVSGIWAIITTHSTVSEGTVAFKDTSSHPIHGGK
jgi:hypothetical protein